MLYNQAWLGYQRPKTVNDSGRVAVAGYLIFWYELDARGLNSYDLINGHLSNKILSE